MKNFLSILMLFSPLFISAQNCVCNEYIYLNDVDGDAIHKFELQNDGTLTEIFNNGGIWYPGSGVSELPAPHGSVTDHQGFVYVAERARGDIRKIDCAGNILPASEYEITGVGGLNFGIIGDLLFTNDRVVLNEVEVFNICSGEPAGSICFEGQATNWGFYIDPNDNTIYAESQFGPKAIYKATEADINSGSCVAPFLTTGANAIPAIGDNYLPSDVNYNPYGITTDPQGNIYIVFLTTFPTPPQHFLTQIYKYSPAGVLLSKSIIDNDGGNGTDGRFSNAIGISYSVTSGLLYTSNVTNSVLEDCISIFDTDPNNTGTLNYVGTGFPNPPGLTGDQLAKGISSFATECCPNDPNQVVNKIVCIQPGSATNFTIPDLYDCSDKICEGNVWSETTSNPAVVYNECLQTVALNNSEAGGCATFSKSSTGGGAAQCGAFSIELNVCLYAASEAPAISITNNVCNPETAGSINVDTPCATGNTIEYSTDAGANWSTTVPTYSNTASITVRARCVNDLESTCFSMETADITSSPEECCPVENCINRFGDFTIQKRIP